MRKILYKYRAINKFTEDIIKNNQFWYAQIHTLNDPNEGMVREITEKEVEEFVRKTKERQIEGFVFQMFMASQGNALFYGLNEGGRKKLQRNIRNKKTLKRRYKYISEFIKEKTGRELSNPDGFITSIKKYLDNAGILSLSEDPINQLMWSHYAENHSGIAIGISDFKSEDYKKVTYTLISEVPGIDLTNNISVLKMYVDKNSYEISPNDLNLQKVLLTKTDEWKYEREWRGIEDKYGLHTIDGEISEIVFGLNCDSLERDKIRQVVLETKRTNIKFKEIYRVPNNYKLFIRDVENI